MNHLNFLKNEQLIILYIQERKKAKNNLTQI
jgi:hypothetical protein